MVLSGMIQSTCFIFHVTILSTVLSDFSLVNHKQYYSHKNRCTRRRTAVPFDLLNLFFLFFFFKSIVNTSLFSACVQRMNNSVVYIGQYNSDISCFPIPTPPFYLRWQEKMLYIPKSRQISTDILSLQMLFLL